VTCGWHRPGADLKEDDSEHFVAHMKRITYLRAALCLPLFSGAIALLLAFIGYANSLISFLLFPPYLEARHCS
jgi:hypothetical protein